LGSKELKSRIKRKRFTVSVIEKPKVIEDLENGVAVKEIILLR
jgi:hypothetical protein